MSILGSLEFPRSYPQNPDFTTYTINNFQKNDQNIRNHIPVASLFTEYKILQFVREGFGIFHVEGLMSFLMILWNIWTHPCISLLLPERLQNQFWFRTDVALKSVKFAESEKIWM